jgi:hypothetical protein
VYLRNEVIVTNPYIANRNQGIQDTPYLLPSRMVEVLGYLLDRERSLCICHDLVH